MIGTVPASLIVRPLTAIAAGEVERFAEACPEAWVQHLPHWARLAQASYGREDASVAVVEQSGRLVGCCPLALKRAWGFRVLESAGFGGYGGPVVSEDLPEPSRAEAMRLMLEAIGEAARRRQADSVHVFPFPGRPDRQPDARWQAAGYRASAIELYLLDLEPSLDALLKQMEQNARHAIRQAQRNGVVVTRGGSPESVDAFYALFVEAHRRSGADVLPRAYFDRLLEPWGSAGAVFHLFTAAEQGRPVASALVGAWKQWAIFSSNGSNDAGLRLRANHLLQWEIIGWLKQQGIRWYELGRRLPGFDSDKQRRIDFFKTRFGVRRVTVPLWQRDMRPVRAALYGALRPWATRIRAR